MKANQKYLRNDEQAVSPVIAVILMVAITVVLAAAVFVLAGRLGQDVGDTGPTLGMATTAPTDATSWQLRITSLTSATQLDQFTCILTAPDGTLTSGNCDTALWVGHQPTGAVTHLNVGDRLTLTGDFAPIGQYSFEIVHNPTGTSSGSVERTV